MNRIEAFGYIAAQAARGDLSFPTSVNAVLRLQQALNEPDCHLEQAIRLVLGEPQLAARTVALANSSAFNAGNAPITNVRAAVTRVGYRNLQMLVASLAVRQFGSRIQDPELRAKAEQLWEHTVQVAALAQVFARRVTFVNPDTAMFAGIVHEIGAFYLLSRADEFPGLLDEDDERWGELCEDVVTREVGRRLGLPEPVAEAVFELRGSWLHMPPSSLLDTLLLANLYARVPSPLGAEAPLPDHSDSALDYLVDEVTLHGIIGEAAELSDSMGQAVLV
ncbi:histidine kinase [Massilia sp. WF1]|uniref:HDOD domain-containing protein n=1 Tax=unclassified Massilia TaxID=2609279 RepID=UPI0006498A1B|nr:MULTISPECIES: HDOD domain-containing protein [unclassified Massilia]ALK98631.1 histidine kinase [Massilia sp. WG5]KLU36944.1 histidine kinase [Massilia sp. WF1]